MRKQNVHPHRLPVVGNSPHLMKFGQFHAPKSWSLLHLLT